MYDVIIIGAGPAGISAGIYAVSRGQKALILEKNQVGGLIRRVSAVTHYAAIVEGNRGKLCKAPEETGGKCRGRNPEDRGEKVELTGVEKGFIQRKNVIVRRR